MLENSEHTQHDKNEEVGPQPGTHPLAHVLHLRREVDRIFTAAPSPIRWTENKDGSGVPVFENEQDSRAFQEAVALARELNERIADYPESTVLPPAKQRAELLASEYGYASTVVRRGSQEFTVCTVSRAELGGFPGMAFTDHGVVFVRDDLPPAVHRFFLEHELKHLEDKDFFENYNGPCKWLLGELRASTHALSDPGSLAAVFAHRLKEGRLGYMARRMLPWNWNEYESSPDAAITQVQINMTNLFGECVA